jgi:D-amino-acid oxidase
VSARAGWSRRELLAGLVATAGLLSLPGRAQDPPPRLRDAILPDPDFARLRSVSPHVIGVRPHRTGGVRLELEPAPTVTTAGKRHIVHNYGHGGAGITLSWGCAAAATELVAEAMGRLPEDEPAAVAVVGTGAIGLTTATELRRRWPKLPVTVYARDLDVRTTTSFVAGGQFEPSGVWHEYTDPARKDVLAGLLRASHQRILGLHQSDDGASYGIAPRLDYTLDHEVIAVDTYTPTDVIPMHRTGTLPFARLSAVGREYATWLMNPTILLPKLAADLAAAGVRFQQRTFADRADLASVAENIVVNCTGYGAKALVGDDGIVAQRGHLVVLDRTDDAQDWFFSGGCGRGAVSYVFCRQTDIVIGGTVVSGQDATAIAPEDDAVFARVLANAEAVFAGKPDSCKA